MRAEGINFKGREEEIRTAEEPVYRDLRGGVEVREILGLAETNLEPGHYYQVVLYNEVDPGTGNATRNFSKRLDYVRFQDGPIPTSGVNGLTNEAMLTILIHRTKTLNDKFPCEENEKALYHMKAALDWFNERTTKRLARDATRKTHGLLNALRR